MRGSLAAGKFEGAAVQHGAARDELQGGGIGGSFGLNEHGFLRTSPVQGRRVSLCITDGRGKGTDQGTPPREGLPCVRSMFRKNALRNSAPSHAPRLSPTATPKPHGEEAHLRRLEPLGPNDSS